MKKILIFLLLFINSTPLFPANSKDIEEIINSIVSSKTNIQDNAEQLTDKDNAAYPEKPETPDKVKEDEAGNNAAFSFPSPDEALLKNGIQLFEASLYENSSRNFEELKTRYPESPYRDLASIWLSKIYLRQNNPEEAIKTLNTIGAESGEYPTALYYIANIHINRGDTAGAINYFYRVASLFPGHELADDSLISIANLYMENNKGNQALEAAVKVINNYKERETLDDAYFIMAQVFEKDAVLKDFSIARKIYKIFLKKTTKEKSPHFSNSPLTERVISNLKNIETKYYGSGLIN